MSVSLNGWDAIRYSVDPRLRTIRIPGTTKSIRCRRLLAPVMAAALADVHDTVINLDRGPVACWVYRDARGGGGLSNHASASATDFRWDVLLADGRRHLSDEQRDALERILNRYTVTRHGKRIFASGKDWRVQDEMHLEVASAWAPHVGSRVTADDVAAVRRRLGITRAGVRTRRGDGTPR